MQLQGGGAGQNGEQQQDPTPLWLKIVQVVFFWTMLQYFVGVCQTLSSDRHTYIYMCVCVRVLCVCCLLYTSPSPRD